MQLLEKYGSLIERYTALIEKVSPCIDAWMAAQDLDFNPCPDNPPDTYDPDSNPDGSIWCAALPWARSHDDAVTAADASRPACVAAATGIITQKGRTAGVCALRRMC
eukprot:SAG31_NODE_3150_length_4617_cov_23.083001_3_plen_107_part_00